MGSKFKYEVEAEILIHNDLENAAYWFSQTVAKKDKGEIEPGGIALDTKAALVFLAFGLEARVNFIGWKILDDGWPERANFWEKMQLLSKVLDFVVDKGKEPWATVAVLKKFRDTLAHGKPEMVSRDEFADAEDEVSTTEILRAKWEKYLTPEFLAKAEDASKTVKQILMDAAKLDAWDATTKGYISKSPSDLS